jgi:hypothetical protein
MCEGKKRSSRSAQYERAREKRFLIFRCLRAKAQGGSKAGASSTHSTRFAQSGGGLAALSLCVDA